jgi:hypothetical protein
VGKVGGGGGKRERSLFQEGTLVIKNISRKRKADKV